MTRQPRIYLPITITCNCIFFLQLVYHEAVKLRCGFVVGCTPFLPDQSQPFPIFRRVLIGSPLSGQPAKRTGDVYKCPVGKGDNKCVKLGLPGKNTVQHQIYRTCVDMYIFICIYLYIYIHKYSIVHISCKSCVHLRKSRGAGSEAYQDRKAENKQGFYISSFQLC